MSKRADQEVQRRLQELSAIEASLAAKLGSDGLLCLCLDAAVGIYDISARDILQCEEGPQQLCRGAGNAGSASTSTQLPHGYDASRFK